ncbi:hypothetical protein TeGR_g6771 [Tetraparma gracilis]|uniref:Uncharacterized protein n=1 Tax=Tetraparma gracilis TaxID=2962635 RepID=A0ABQ6N014_9STRA|nr:hypothetical protein TeGR_g6771 [Tetraparma gracilis]
MTSGIHKAYQDDQKHRSVPVDPEFYDMVDGNIIGILMDTCKPLFDLVSGAHEDEDPEALKPADLMMSVAKLIVAAGFKMKEQARQEMAEEDLGGGMFDEDVVNMREGAAKCLLPQQYTAEERETLDKQLAEFNAPAKALKKYKTGMKLLQTQTYDDGHGMKVFLDEFLFHIFRNKMQVGASQTSFSVNTPLVALTANEAGRIGRSLVNILMANATGEAAVDELIGNYEALGELESEYSWFRPMMNAIAVELMSKVAYSVKVRAAIGAGVSMADTASDAYMINNFFNSGRAGTAKALLGMVGANLLCQSLVVYVQTAGLKKNRWRATIFEILSVVTFSKPGLDAYRVASGAEQESAMPPLMEMTSTKISELVCEGLPGLILQLVALLRAENKGDVSAIVSLLISSASTALTATTIFYDNETHPTNKKRFPDWIGLVPDAGRTEAFAAAFLLSAFQVIAKAAATALLAVTNGTWLLAYMATDHAVHLMYRICRRDMLVFTATPLPYVFSSLLFTGFKVVGDFTGSLNVRLPLLLGGSYFAANLVMSHASVFVAIYLYSEYAEDSNKIPSRYLWEGAAGLLAAWVTTFAFFTTRVAVPRLRYTLWSPATAKQVTIERFTKGKDDESKLGILRCQRLMWEAEIGGEVKKWTLENWARWTEEAPEWFNEQMIGCVHDEYIPPQFLAQLGGANRERRGSANVSVRESMRRASFSAE